MLVIARSTQKELARHVSYLIAENQMLRSRLPAKISLTQREKNRLVRFAKKLGSALNELATIVHQERFVDGFEMHQPKNWRAKKDWKASNP